MDATTGIGVHKMKKEPRVWTVGNRTFVEETEVKFNEAGVIKTGYLRKVLVEKDEVHVWLTTEREYGFAKILHGVHQLRNIDEPL